MAEFVPDIYEQILLRLDVKDLIICKCVCKSWQSIISHHSFIKAHLKNHHNKQNFQHRRILMSLEIGGPSTRRLYYSYLIGSSNGLVCINPLRAKEALVANPFTREVRKLPTPQIPVDWSSLIRGFGYDSSTDDYKFVIGFTPSIGKNRTCFKVLTLKSNVWKIVGQVKHRHNLDRPCGILCNGALHWLMDDWNKNKIVIVSFDLSKEKFKEIPQPDDTRYECREDSRLGIVEDCLCIFSRRARSYHDHIWVMKKYNVKQSWEMLPHFPERDDDSTLHLKLLHNYISYEGSFFENDFMLPRICDYFVAPIFVPSLVSPYASRILKRKIA